MGRKPTITRGQLLDIAEEIVRTEGAKALTVEALARAAGISKGGVQYSFASKDELVRALIERWTSQFDAILNTDETLSAVDLIRSYIRSMRASQPAMNAKMAALMSTYLQNPANMLETRQWYQGVFDRIGTASAEAQAARVAFLAVEGLFLLRIVGIDEDGAWAEFLDDIEAMLNRLLDLA
ncbi:TetR/AcrR family transcriptional regulator [Shinella sp. WSJ-2]|uniref:TetR/AcrR family transcriptional regulator n=1 Tax=Shinella sp. WSJ-2 TaxID=2303749 RepID=UPI000E3D1E2B|nr:TetR/AcrR family transcriptional regulator [Shinella sp. WSJ-2]RFZ82453.1 TetR/AcrR family transcriptional regulator [Shinella sp. WSJ-2]